MLASCSSHFGDPSSVAEVMTCWHAEGMEAAKAAWALSRPTDRRLLPLEQELEWRLGQGPGPRILLDGLWFGRPPGGIGRVWQQILSCWSLPGLLTPQAPVRLIDRDSFLAITSRFESVVAPSVDPLDPDAVASLADANGRLSREWNAQVFLSSWTSVCGDHAEAASELALVHDCMPERSEMPEALAQQRRRWLHGAKGQVAVSAASANDVEQLRKMPLGSVPWCHPAVAAVFEASVRSSGAERLWDALVHRAGLWPDFVLLPATSGIGTYKNPELVAAALATLPEQQLVLSGTGAEACREELVKAYPDLQGRCISIGFTEPELALAYHHALAVVIPSRIEGFGMPALETFAASGILIAADSRGLREAAAEAGLRISPDQPQQLHSLLKLLSHPSSRQWLQQRLEPRRQQRLQRCSADLLGLTLLAAARVLAAKRGSVR